jgi:hypothetical protein
LLHGGVRDELTQSYAIRTNPDFALLFGLHMWGKVDLAQRRALGRNPWNEEAASRPASATTPEPVGANT